MKKLVSIFLTFSCFCLAFFLIFYIPAHFYNHMTGIGGSSSFLELKINETYFSPQDFKVHPDPLSLTTKKSLSVYFGDFRFDLPDESFTWRPDIMIEKGKVYPALQAIRGDRVEFEVRLRNQFPFNHDLLEYKVFRLPIVKNDLSSLSKKQVWKTLFSKNISESARIKWDFSYSEEISDLYILKLREVNFPKGFSRFGFFSDRDIAVFKMGEEAGLLKERVFFLKGDVIHDTQISFVPNERGKALRQFFLASAFIEKWNDLDRKEYYQNYSLRSEHNSANETVITLFSLWSQDTKDKFFLVELIQSLEKKNTDISIRKSLQNYSMKKYGSDFSLPKEKSIPDESGFGGLSDGIDEIQKRLRGEY